MSRADLNLAIGSAPFAGLSLAALLAIVLVLYIREQRRRTRAERDLHRSHAELELRVLQRTDELLRANERLGRNLEAKEDTEEEMQRLLDTAGHSRLALLSMVEDQQRSEEALRASGEDLRALARHLEQIREEQATRIAGELHDELGQALTILKLHVNTLQRKLRAAGQPAALEGGEAVDLIDDAMRSVRQLCMELRPPVLDHLGLRPAIRALAADFQSRSEIGCTLHAPDELPVFDMPCQTAVYRIVQELLTNVARHAEASEVRIALRLEGASLAIEVADNGRGIADEKLSGSGSLGLVGMRERALAHGGSITISGRPGGGTRGLVRIPLPLSTGDS